MEITSLDNAKIKYLEKLKRNKEIDKIKGYTSIRNP